MKTDKINVGSHLICPDVAYSYFHYFSTVVNSYFQHLSVNYIFSSYFIEFHIVKPFLTSPHPTLPFGICGFLNPQIPKRGSAIS